MARQPALALDRFDHRGFFAADVGAGAAAQMDLGELVETGALELGDLVEQHQAKLGIFVADVDVDLGRFDHPGGDQHAFEEAVRIEAEIVAVLERAGLALVGVDRHQARAWLGAHQRPLAAGRKAGAAEAAQPGVADDLDQLVARALAGEGLGQHAIAAGRHVMFEVGAGVQRVRMRGRIGNLLDRRIGRLVHLHMADGTDRRVIAGAHAGRAHDPHVRAERLRQILQQAIGTRHRAGQRVADAHGDRRRRRLALLHHIEMRVEGRDLIDLGLRELHLGGERGQVRAGDVAVLVLDQMQMLDQQIALARAVAEQRCDLVGRAGIDLPALGRAARPCGDVALRRCRRNAADFERSLLSPKRQN